MAKINALLVAGGGGSGGNGGGGGGAGGVIQVFSSELAVGTYSITVGTGGAGAINNTSKGSNGTNTTFNGLTAIGGGGGSARDNATPTGLSGGSGGGGATASAGGTGTAGQGNNGASGVNTFPYGGGGGGGAGANGTASNNGGSGGVGIASSITGVSVYYAGGGAGGTALANPGSGVGGNGGGGNPNTNGTNGLGGGAGGGSQGSTTGYTGGSGVCIIAYFTGTITATGGTITTSGGYTIHTFTTSGTLTVTYSQYSPIGKLGEFIPNSNTKTLYHLDGNSNDSSGNSYNGTPTNVSWQNGNIGSGSAGLFTNAYIKNTSLWSAMSTSNRFYSCIVKLSSYANFAGIMLFMGPSNNFVGMGTLSTSGGVRFREGGGDVIGSYTIPLNTPTHLAMSYNYSTGLVKVYVNGSLLATYNGTAGYTMASGSFDIGVLETTVYKLNGTVDEVIIENRVWSDNEVKKYYSHLKGRLIN